MRWIAAVVFWPTLAWAQGAECFDETHLANLPQQPLNACAQHRYTVADAELNSVWQRLESDYGAMPALREAQRAWLLFRDLACDAEAESVRGGSLYPMVLNDCLERQTLHRIEDLLRFGGIR